MSILGVVEHRGSPLRRLVGEWLSARVGTADCGANRPSRPGMWPSQRADDCDAVSTVVVARRSIGLRRLTVPVQQAVEPPKLVDCVTWHGVGMEMHDLVTDEPDFLKPGDEGGTVQRPAQLLPDILVLQDTLVVTDGELVEAGDRPAAQPPDSPKVEGAAQDPTERLIELA